MDKRESLDWIRPIFIPEGMTSLAELGDNIKNEISHRAQAVINKLCKFSNRYNKQVINKL